MSRYEWPQTIAKRGREVAVRVAVGYDRRRGGFFFWVSDHRGDAVGNFRADDPLFESVDPLIRALRRAGVTPPKGLSSRLKADAESERRTGKALRPAIFDFPPDLRSSGTRRGIANRERPG